jgi:hypothetical protein
MNRDLDDSVDRREVWLTLPMPSGDSCVVRPRRSLHYLQQGLRTDRRLYVISHLI